MKNGSDRAFHVLVVILVILTGIIGWLLSDHLSELDSRIDLVRDQLLKSCLRPLP